ncbi:sushi, nidogen and EGF-like domain-containing protein 1 isoform X2 [Stegodyphus dumicola]|uniref:sushi, nidogen and EGF-like domain-containing protein 1 isoform X2 n=1 Tax=Stegodyphus dumicola TaxID=202533 RepID=UPI0015A9FDC9|nr:sushi, nidogen and EGF-like domain-containing protein 1 isoform X2 [Stegodyphus dumicola]
MKNQVKILCKLDINVIAITDRASADLLIKSLNVCAKKIIAEYDALCKAAKRVCAKFSDEVGARQEIFKTIGLYKNAADYIQVAEGGCRAETCYGGRCEIKDEIKICICPKGFHLKGIGCQETVCEMNKCFGGKCDVVDGQEICTCLDGYILNDNTCEKIRCTRKRCFGGKCELIEGEEVCECPDGYVLQGDACRALKLN